MHWNSVEKMIIANKCDMAEHRVVSKEQGEAVRILVSACVGVMGCTKWR